MIIYLPMAVLLLAAALWLARPWWAAGGSAAAMQRRAANVAAYRQRLLEIDADLAAGLIEPAAADTLRQELGARLLLDAQAEPAAAEPALPVRRNWRIVALAATLLGVFGAGFYAWQGSWQTQALVALAQSDPAGAELASIEEMTARLAERLQQQPDDVEGWIMLGRSYFASERYADAAQAYAKVNTLTEHQQPDWLVNEGEALALSRDRDLQGRPQQLFEQALALAPQHAKALWYAGLTAVQAGDRGVARARWQVLAQQEIPPELKLMLDQQLQSLGEPGLAEAPPPASEPAKVEAASLRLRLSLKPELLAKVPAGATLFVFARAASGPPMPLAVYRGLATELPLQVTLDDSMAMMPTMKLSQFDRWIVGARISAAGQAKAQSGDLEGSFEIGREQAQAPLDLVIDRIVP